MQNKKLFVSLGILILLVGIAAFIAGRILNSGVGPVGLGGPMEGQVFISRDDFIPAPELPTTPSEITGLFIERKDNTVIIQTVSFDAGVGGIAGDSPMDSDPIVEVLITGETIIYRETTDFSLASAGENFTVQQTVEESTLDHLNSQTMITVWGRRSGDRIIADILFYSNPLMLNK
ncbi:MAG: hypothetical protein L0287_05710 [Anaerolineae bacterium]|nr:hypothetical protein [Anaerolineae bacterium]